MGLLANEWKKEIYETFIGGMCLGLDLQFTLHILFKLAKITYSKSVQREQDISIAVRECRIPSISTSEGRFKCFITKIFHLVNILIYGTTYMKTIVSIKFTQLPVMQLHKVDKWKYYKWSVWSKMIQAIYFGKKL